MNNGIAVRVRWKTAMSRGVEAWWAAKARINDFDKLSYAGKETVQYDIGCERLQTYRDFARATCDRGKKAAVRSCAYWNRAQVDAHNGQTE